MNSVYKKVHRFAIQLMNAAEEDDHDTFNQLYDELAALCNQYSDTDNDHPAQWEALADFSEDFDDAKKLYQRASELAEQQALREYVASINYSWAVLLGQLNEKDLAKQHAQKALLATKGSKDKALISDIKKLL